MADKLTLGRLAMKDRSTAHLRVYVGGLTEKDTVDEVYEHFIGYGQINGIIVNRNFGFVQFELESSAQDAIAKANGRMFKGKILSVKTAQTTDKRYDTSESATQQEAPSALQNDNSQTGNEEYDEPYDVYGNFVDPNYRDEEVDSNHTWAENNGNVESRGRGRGRGLPRGRGRGVRGRGAAAFRDCSPMDRNVSGSGDWPERGYERYSQPIPEYPRAIPVSERNDCEIIVVSKSLTEYAEYIESRLKRLGIVVDLLFPMEDVPIGKVLGNIASRGCLYAILVMPQNQEHRSLTLTILHGLPQEHRNMPLEDALQLLSRNFQEVQRGGPSGREAVYALLGQLADGRTLTVLQYDKVMEYLQERREQQVKIELGEPLNAPASKTQVDLQQRILSILNDKKVTPAADTPRVPSPPPTQPTSNKLLNDPTVRKALDSILQKFV
ncbi:uncharacterized protein LOC115440050 [Manduca sexta]|uniref:RRM domain-containing protein n=1 Tax=Manduca sexta TaxID=7130 RepID=A0A922CG78_MANSE|nr:uncharacterized protein LOC115440050 [Manduca sexta]KAG6444769.1 hypothetical protein O3G_MSEX003535 [Manduca sexta]